MVARRTNTVSERFERYHRSNPHVYGLFKRFAAEAEARASGLRRFSADALLHRIRWFVAVETRGEWKCNNDAAAFEDMIQELHAAMHPAWTFEQLLYHPEDGRRFCHAVRARAGQGLPDEMILRRLNNVRKKSGDRKAA